MKDIKRIPKVLKAIEKIWKKYPDLRLCQLIGNFFPGDNYMVEDDELIADLKKGYNTVDEILKKSAKNTKRRADDFPADDPYSSPY